MSDLLKEIYIKRLEREKKAGTESEKIASVNAAYQQTGKVKGQREIDSLRQKSAALQVQSIEQNTAADKEQQKAEEQISRAQKLRDFNYDFYMDMLSEGIYDPNAARALGVSEKAYKGVLAKVQAAKAAKTATRKKASDTTEEIVEEIPAEESGELTYAQKQAAARRAMNVDVDGDGKRGKSATQGKKATVQELTSITQNPHEAAFAAEVNEIKASSNAIKELQSIPMSKAEADAAVKQLKTDGFYLHNSVQQQLKKTEQAEKLSTDYGFDTKTAITVNELQGMVQRHGNEKVMSTLLKYKNIGTDAETYTQNVIAEVVLADQAGKKRALKTEEKAMLFLMKDSSKVTENGRQMIDSVLAYDFKATLNEYRKKCKAMSNAELQAESENPKQEGMYSGYAAMVVGEELDKRFDAQRDEALNVLNEYSASSDEVTSPDIIASVTDSIESKLNGLIDPDEMISELEAKLGAYAQRGVILEEDQKKLDAYRADYDKLKKEYDAAKKKYEEDLAALNAVDPLTLAYYSENEQRRKELSEKGAPLVGRLTAIWQTREKGKDVAMMGDPRDITGYSPHVSSLPKFDKWDYWDRDAKIAGFSFSYNDLTAAEQDIVNYLLGKYPDTVSQDFGGSEGVF